ncbi:hypothetical protein [Methyloligella solikamskensis]|uniref:Uncharacterized protein n=1 Tax=Methyloligella solikamskensis TaxID=1177756 RepID=A0ABW3J896_9HYPH
MDGVTLIFRLHRLSWQIKAQAVEASFRRLVHAFKYNPNQPRVPAGNPDGGQWTDGNGGGGGGGSAIASAEPNTTSERNNENREQDRFLIPNPRGSRARRRLAGDVIPICIVVGLAQTSHETGPIEYTATYECRDGRTFTHTSIGKRPRGIWVDR